MLRRRFICFLRLFRVFFIISRVINLSVDEQVSPHVPFAFFSPAYRVLYVESVDTGIYGIGSPIMRPIFCIKPIIKCHTYA